LGPFQKRLALSLFLGAAPLLWTSPLEEAGLRSGRGPAVARFPDARCADFFQAICSEERPQPGSAFPDPTGEMLEEREALQSVASLIQSETSNPHSWIERLYSPERVRKVREIEGWVKQALLRWIREGGGGALSVRDQKELLTRVGLTKVEFPNPQRGYAGDPELLIQHGAFYEVLKKPGSALQRIRLGGAYVFGTGSRYNWIFTLAHEFAHSFDPCELRASGWTPPAFERLNSCLIAGGVVQTPPGRRECLQQDQLSEAFADWIAAEILFKGLMEFGSEYPSPQRWAAVSNSVRDLCPSREAVGPADSDNDDSEWHPIAQTRINGLLGQHPGIRAYLGCPPPDQSTCRLGDQ
jgi:hypothetical protein